MAPWNETRQPKTFILFLDTGDICRCPMAKGLMAKLMAEKGITHIEIMTAGVMTTPSILPTAETRLLLKEANIDIGRYRSSQYSEALIRKADLVLGMSPFHVQKAKRLTTDARDKTFLLKEYSRSDPKNVQIPDPMGATLEVYRRVFREIRESCERLIEMDVVRVPKPIERDDVPTQRTKPTRALRSVSARKLGPSEATNALLGVMAAERRAKLAAESVGYPGSESEIETVVNPDGPPVRARRFVFDLDGGAEPRYVSTDSSSSTSAPSEKPAKRGVSRTAEISAAASEELDRAETQREIEREAAKAAAAAKKAEPKKADAKKGADSKKEAPTAKSKSAPEPKAKGKPAAEAKEKRADKPAKGAKSDKKAKPAAKKADEKKAKPAAKKPVAKAVAKPKAADKAKPKAKPAAKAAAKPKAKPAEKPKAKAKPAPKAKAKPAKKKK
jgi:protein-tyrosine-phosphatase